MVMYQNDEVLSLLTCLVLHISLGSFGGRGETFMDECVCVCVGGGGVEL